MVMLNKRFFVVYILLVMVVHVVLAACTPDPGLVEDKNQGVSFKIVTEVHGMTCIVGEGHIQDSATNTQWTGMTCNWSEFVPPAVTLDGNTELKCNPNLETGGFDCTRIDETEE